MSVNSLVRLTLPDNMGAKLFIIIFLKHNKMNIKKCHTVIYYRQRPNIMRIKPLM
jgi:hypothetical protein